MAKVWPNWHDHYDFDEYMVERFAPTSPGLYMIRMKDREWYESILVLDGAPNIKEALLKHLSHPKGTLKTALERGEILEFRFFRAKEYEKLRDDVLENLRDLRNTG
ncbi:MAG: hypothetical protein GXO39_09485 [Thermotogae bacterium]|nr:hypothetical protein [Thermotogota bacterium]